MINFELVICNLISIYITNHYVFSFSFNHMQSEHMTDIKTSVLYVSGKPNMVTLDYLISTDNSGDEVR